MNDNNQFQQQPQYVQTPPPKKKNNTVLIIVLVVVGVLAMMGVGCVLVIGTLYKNFKGQYEEIESVYEDTKETIKEEMEEQKTPTKQTTASDQLFQVNINGVTINFPCTKDDFKGTGWEWDEKYAKKDLASNYTTSGGRIGKYPGGVIVNVINKSQETKHIEDCIIDDGTFYNPKDGSEKITFVGGLTYDSTITEVKNKMNSLGYTNVKETTIDNSVFLTYYKDNDQNDFRNKIEFYFYNDVISYISILTEG